jgi:hypothetical protein
MNSLIELVCHAHTQRHAVGPLITRVDDLWAYCEGQGDHGHEWMRVEPTRREDVGDLTRMQDRRAS